MTRLATAWQLVKSRALYEFLETRSTLDSPTSCAGSSCWWLCFCSCCCPFCCCSCCCCAAAVRSYSACHSTQSSC
jgi:hypothetical protein